MLVSIVSGDGMGSSGQRERRTHPDPTGMSSDLDRDADIRPNASRRDVPPALIESVDALDPPLPRRDMS